MIEAMACGTPVLAFDRGAAREVIDEGVTGRIVGTLDEAVAVLPEVLALNRTSVRQRFEERFSAARMAADYLLIYERMQKVRRLNFTNPGSTAKAQPELPSRRVMG